MIAAAIFKIFLAPAPLFELMSNCLGCVGCSPLLLRRGDPDEQFEFFEFLLVKFVS